MIAIQGGGRDREGDWEGGREGQIQGKGVQN